MPGGFFKKPPAIRNEDIEPISDTMPPPAAPSTTTGAATSGSSSEHLLAPTTSWLSAISARRGSNMFEGGMSPMDGDNSNDAAYHHGSGGGHSGSGGHSEASFRSNTLAIPKSVFSAFNDDSTGGSMYADTPMQNAPLITVSEGGQIVVQDLEVLQNTHLTEKVTTAIPITDFPIATKESLAELKGMKERLETITDDQDMFEMDVEPSSSRINVQAGQGQVSGDKPPSKLVSYIMEKGFAQSWFFKNGDGANYDLNPEEVAKMIENQTRTAMPIHDNDENATTIGIFKDQGTNSRKTSAKDQQTDFVGLFEKRKEEQKKKESREEAYFHAPQNY